MNERPPEELERHKKLIAERARIQYGLNIDEWATDECGQMIGKCGRWRAVEDNDDEGLFEDDEGELRFSIVGAPQYGNERLYAGFVADGTDGPVEVTPFQDIDSI